MAWLPQPLPRPSVLASRPGTPPPQSVPPPHLPASTSVLIDPKGNAGSAFPGQGSTSSHLSAQRRPLRRSAQEREQAQKQEHQLEHQQHQQQHHHRQKQIRKQGYISPSPLLSYSSQKMTPIQLNPGSQQQHHQHQQHLALQRDHYRREQIQHIHSRQLSPQQETRILPIQLLQVKNTATKPTPRSPDPGYLDALDGYFSQNHYELDTAEDSHSEDDSQVDNEEDHRDEDRNEDRCRLDSMSLVSQNKARRERRRSRSVCELVSSIGILLSPPMTPEGTLLISPANDGTVTTPPPSSRIPYTPRKRHHSCVAPNTKEFQTLATMFGWVTLSAPDAWPKRPGRQRNETTEAAIEQQQHFSNNHVVVGDSEDESDLETVFQHCAIMEWSTSRESRNSENSEFTDSCLQSPMQDAPLSDSSVEFMRDFGDLAFGSFSRQQSAKRDSVLNPTQSDEQGSSSESESEYSSRKLGNGCISNLKPGTDNVMRRSMPPHQAPLKIEPPSKEPTRVQQRHSFRFAPLFTKGAMTETEHSLSGVHTDQHATEILLPESAMTKSSGEISLMSPLSFSRGQDSGYMSLSCNFLGQSVQAFAIDIASSHNDDHHDIPLQPMEQARENPPEADHQTTDCSFEPLQRSSQEQRTAPSFSPPPIPPRYPEIDMRAFDHLEDEGPDSIIYAPPKASKRDSLSGTHELRPIIAATIVKLIEKLTHQYGMDSRFMTDFFLTYRLFLSPVHLCKYLIRRYLWALEEDTESRLVVRVRTFVVFRYWINNHFADDFLTSKSLRFQMGTFLNGMLLNPRVLASPRDNRIIRNLTEFLKHQRRYYKSLAEQTLSREQQHLEQEQQRTDDQDGAASVTTASQDATRSSHDHQLDAEGIKASEVERLALSAAVIKHAEPLAAKVTTSDLSGTITIQNSAPIKGRHRASTLAGTTSRSMVVEANGSHSAKPPLSKDSRATSMSRQMSEGGTIVPRERRLSTSSIKSNKSSSTWSTKMSMFSNKLRQKSEDIYQHFVHPAAGTSKNGDNRNCVCWTPAYTGITEHHALNTTRSHPNLRPSVVVSKISYQDPAAGAPPPPSQSSSSEASTSSTSAHVVTSVVPSNKSIKRLKSSINLGLSSPAAEPSPTPSPTRNQFSTISSRHSRSNSNSSMGYHPNPECPYHVPCLGTMSKGATAKKSQGPLDRDTCATLQEALQDEFVDLAAATQQEQELQLQPTLPNAPNSIPPSPAWQYCPWHTTAAQQHSSSSASATAAAIPMVPVYKPFILFYRSQMIAQQLCLLEQHFLEQVRWEELLEMELTKAGRKNKSKSQSSISGYLFKAESERNGMKASNERSNMLCMWVASEVVSTHPIDDRVRVVEKFIRIAQKCYQYRNLNSLIQLVMGLGSWQLCRLRRTWAKVGTYEMRILQELQDFISPCNNWGVIRRAMNEIGHCQEVPSSPKGAGQRSSMQGSDALISSGSSFSATESIASNSQLLSTEAHGGSSGHGYGHSSKYLHQQVALEKQGCIPFLGLFVYDLTHIVVSPAWYLPQSPVLVAEGDQQHQEGNEEMTQHGCHGGSTSMSIPPTPMGASHPAMAARLQAPDPKDLKELLPTGKLLVHFHRYQLIAKTIKWFLAFQCRPQKYTFAVDSTLYSKCFLLRVLSNERIQELADSCESE